MKKTLTLSEHTSNVLPLAPDAAGFLAGECRDLLSIEPVRTDEYRIRTRHHVGVVFGPGIELRIEPKCSVGAMFHLLSHCYGLVQIRRELAAYAQARNLFELFVSLLLHRLEALVRAGIRRDYRARRDHLRVVRGRIDARRSVATLLRSEPRLFCEFEELTEDVFDNQVIRFTLERIRQLPILSQPIHARARRLRHTFSAVSIVPIRSRDIERRGYDRLTQAYEPIHGLCRLLLDGCGLDADAGHHHARGFVVDMNLLFERFVLAKLAKLAKPPLSVGGQVPLSLDHHRFVRIQPDIVLSWGRRPILVADTKYKRTDDEQVPNADIYQALAYARALGVKTAYLLYPAWEHEPRRLTVRDSANEVVIDTVPLAEVPGRLDAAIVRLMTRMRRDALRPAISRPRKV